MSKVHLKYDSASGLSNNQVVKYNTSESGATPSIIFDDGVDVSLSSLTNTYKIGSYTAIKMSQGVGASNISLGHSNTLNDSGNGGAIAIGQGVTSSDDGIAIGLSSIVDSGTVDGIAIGRNATINNGSIRGIAIGRDSLVSASNAFAIGNYTTASQADTIIIGNNSIGNKPNVGIGTSSPQALLHVDGLSGSNKTIMIKSTGVDNGIIIDSGEYPFFSMRSAGNTSFQLQGIGANTILFRPTSNVGWRDYSNSDIVGMVGMNAPGHYSYFRHNVAIGNGTPSARLYINGVDNTSSNHALKIFDSGSTELFSVRNDGFIYHSDSMANNVSSIQFFNTNTGTGFDYKGYYGRLSLGVTNTTNQATLSLTDYGTVQNFINFDNDGAKGYIHGLGGGITFRGFNNSSQRFIISSDDAFLSNNGYRNWFSGRMVIGPTPFSTTTQLVVQGSGDTSAGYAFDVQNSGYTSILSVRNDNRVGINNINPTERLDVAGNVKAYSTIVDGNTYYGVRFNNSGFSRFAITNSFKLDAIFTEGFVFSNGSYNFFNYTQAGNDGDSFQLANGLIKAKNSGFTDTSKYFAINVDGTPSAMLQVKGSGVSYGTASLALYSSASTKMYDFTDAGRFRMYDPTGTYNFTFEAEGTTGLSEIVTNKSGVVFDSANGEYSFRRTSAGGVLLYTNGKQLNLSATVGGSPNVSVNTSGELVLSVVNSASTATTVTNLAVDNTGKVVSNGVGHTKYTALLSQSGTSDPTTIVFENTRGVTGWTRTNTGFYKSVGLVGMTPNNTMTGFGNWNGQAGTYIPISDQSSVIGYYSVYVGVDGELWIDVYNNTFTNVDLSTLMDTAAIPIDIKFYS